MFSGLDNISVGGAMFLKMSKDDPGYRHRVALRGRWRASPRFNMRAPLYDVALKSGRVIDPASGFSAVTYKAIPAIV